MPIDSHMPGSGSLGSRADAGWGSMMGRATAVVTARARRREMMEGRGKCMI